MRKKAIWLVGPILGAGVVWFIGASYTFILLIGLRQCSCAAAVFFNAIGLYEGDAGNATGFYDQVVAAGYHPWMAYWTYRNQIGDQTSQYLYIDSAIIALLPLVLSGAIAYRMAIGSRTRRKLTRWPWQDDSHSPLA